MGLAIARGIIEAHGGKIWIEDGPGGRGARVIFTLPVGDDEPAQEEVKDEPEAAHSRG
jgi:two-component system sensor histidine kinase KdpD